MAPRQPEYGEYLAYDDGTVIKYDPDAPRDPLVIADEDIPAFPRGDVEPPDDWDLPI